MIAVFLQNLTRLVGNFNQHRYLLAVSGGADSSVMTHLFHDAGLDFAMAHCNFHLRGEASNHDMRMVKDLSTQLGRELFLQEFNTLELQENSGLSVEMMARKLRYEWFEEVGKGFDFLVTAHHANDAAETMLLNLSRGTGLKGLCAIPERNGKIIRPLLSFTAEEIRHYAQTHHIAYAIDSTNEDETIQRNRIRHTVIPALTQLNPNLIHTLEHDRHVLQQQYDFYQRKIEELKRELTTTKDDVTIVNYSVLEGNPDKKVILYELLSDYGFSSSVADTLCAKMASGRTFYSTGHTLVFNRGELLIKPRVASTEHTITCTSMEELQEHFCIEAIHTEGPAVFEKDNRVFYLPQRLLTWPITLRCWQNGDYFFPLGSKGKQKLSDFFTDHKIDRFTKQQIPLFCVGDDIAWIIGYRSDHRYRVTSKDSDYYKITYKNGLKNKP